MAQNHQVLRPREVAVALVVWPLATLLMLAGLVAIFWVAFDVAQDPHRTLWRIALFVLAGVAWLVALPGALFIRSNRRGDPKIRQLNWLGGTVLLTSVVGLSILLIVGTS